MRLDMGIPATGAAWAAGELEELLAEAEEQLAAAQFFDVGSEDVTMLAEIIVYGDSGCFLDKAGRCACNTAEQPRSLRKTTDWQCRCIHAKTVACRYATGVCYTLHCILTPLSL